MNIYIYTRAQYVSGTEDKWGLKLNSHKLADHAAISQPAEKTIQKRSIADFSLENGFNED